MKSGIRVNNRIVYDVTPETAREGDRILLVRNIEDAEVEEAIFGFGGGKLHKSGYRLHVPAYEADGKTQRKNLFGKPKVKKAHILVAHFKHRVGLGSTTGRAFAYPVSHVKGEGTRYRVSTKVDTTRGALHVDPTRVDHEEVHHPHPTSEHHTDHTMTRSEAHSYVHGILKSHKAFTAAETKAKAHNIHNHPLHSTTLKAHELHEATKKETKQEVFKRQSGEMDNIVKGIGGHLGGHGG